jgi:hypothetical protein
MPIHDPARDPLRVIYGEPFTPYSAPIAGSPSARDYLTKDVAKIDAVAHEQTGFDHLAGREARRYPIACREQGELRCAAGEKAVGADEHGIAPFTRNSGEGRVDLSGGACVEEKDVQPKGAGGFLKRFRCGIGGWGIGRPGRSFGMPSAGPTPPTAHMSLHLKRPSGPRRQAAYVSFDRSRAPSR